MMESIWFWMAKFFADVILFFGMVVLIIGVLFIPIWWSRLKSKFTKDKK